MWISLEWLLILLLVVSNIVLSCAVFGRTHDE